jgi:hypothetical protein
MDPYRGLMQQQETEDQRIERLLVEVNGDLVLKEQVAQCLVSAMLVRGVAPEQAKRVIERLFP